MDDVATLAHTTWECKYHVVFILCSVPTPGAARWEYITNMEDVLALYEKPYSAKAPVICLDEKPVSLHAEVRPAHAPAWREGFGQPQPPSKYLLV